MIGFDAKRAFNNASGLGNYSRDHLRMCHSHLPEQSLCLFTPGKKEPFTNFAADWANTEVVMPRRGFGKLSPSWWRSFGLMPELRRRDLSVFHGLSASLPAGIARWRGKKVVTIHDLIFEKYPRWYKRADRVIHRRKVQHAVKAADVVVAISQETADDLTRFYNVPSSKIRVIYQSCHPAFRIVGEPGGVTDSLPDNYALYVGTIEPRKHLGELLEAVAKTRDLPLVVVGRKTAYFKQIAKRYGELQQTGLLYEIQPDMAGLAEVMRKASFVCYPSQAEGFGIPMVEALFSGVPILAGNSPCLREVGGDAALYVNPFDVEAIETAYRQLSDDAALRAYMADITRIRREHFTPNVLTEQWRNAYGLGN